MSARPTPLQFRTILGFFIAPATPAIAVAVIGAAVALMKSSDPSIMRDNEYPVGLMLMALSYAAAIAMNLPLYVVFRRCGWNSLWTTLASGALQGVMVYPACLLATGAFSKPLWQPRAAVHGDRNALRLVGRAVFLADRKAGSRRR